MFSSTSIEQQHQEFKRQISGHDTYPCFLLDQTFRQRMSSPTSNTMPSYLSAETFSPLAKSPIAVNNSRPSTKQSNQSRLFSSSPSNPINRTRTNIRSTTQIVDVPIEKTIVPLKTMADLFPSFSYTNMSMSNKKLSNYFPSTDHQTLTSTTAISVFGFREEDLEFILQQFKDIGSIEKIERPLGCENGNFINIIYANHVSYQNALNRNGIIFNGRMIGVVPLITK